MPIDDLPGSLSVPTRDTERDRWLRDYRFRDPSSETTEGTQPWIDGSTMADAVMPLYHDIKLVADATDPAKIGGALLDTQAGADGVIRPAAVGASGSVTASASVGGGTIFAGDEIIGRSLRYKCIATALYNNGDEVPIQGIDTGPATNLAAGTVMTWTSPRPGINANAPVTEQPDGSGLTGGRDKATDEEYRLLWQEARQSRPASGNDAEIQELAEQTFGFSVEKAYTYPGILGPSTTCIAFTLKPASTGASRVPNPSQIAAVLANVVGAMPADEGIFGATLIAEPVDLSLLIRWDPGGAGWSDLVTWPEYDGIAGQAITVASATDATHFVLKSANGDYTDLIPPSAGKTIGFYDLTFATFRRKKILTVTGSGPWTIVCDTSNSASDEGYIPVVNTRAMPWSESLQDLVLPLAGYFETLGPGEQVSGFFGSGVLQRRQPTSPRSYPNVVTTKGLEGAMENVASVFDVTFEEPGTPLATTVGTAGVDCNLLELGHIAAFPL